MDQIKIGKFIQEQRKKLNLTQKELAEKLYISDKTVSKWETGNGLPEVSIMQPLCDTLNISINELLSGQTLDNDKIYHDKAEANMLALAKERKQAKSKIMLSILIFVPAFLAVIALIMICSYIEMPDYMRAIILAISIILLTTTIIVISILDREAGVYECKHCGHKFVPDMKSYILGMHSLTTRYLKCPKCNKKSFCKRHLS